jgi:uncharacterized protein YecE (DUF72 family)
MSARTEARRAGSISPDGHDSRAFIGTSGWNYPAWREAFYRGVPQRLWLPFCAGHFTAVEVNATFYRLQRRETFARWRAGTPREFRFAIKANRYLTHNRRLAEPMPSIRLERDRATGLGGKLAAVLWQLPQNFHRDVGRLERFARALRCWRRVHTPSSSAMARGSTRKSPPACASTASPCASRTPPTGRCGMR